MVSVKNDISRAVKLVMIFSKSQNVMIFLKMSRLFLNISLVIKGALRLFLGWGKSSVETIT